MKQNIFKLLACGAALALLTTSCKKGLDYENTGVIAPENVWKDPNMIGAYLNDI